MWSGRFWTMRSVQGQPHQEMIPGQKLTPLLIQAIAIGLEGMGNPLACLDPLGERRGERDYSLTPKVYGQFLIDLFDLWYLDLRQGRQPFIRQFENYINSAPALFSISAAFRILR